MGGVYYSIFNLLHDSLLIQTLDKIRSTDMDNVAIVTLTKQGKIQLDLDLDQDDLKTIF